MLDKFAEYLDQHAGADLKSSSPLAPYDWVYAGLLTADTLVWDLTLSRDDGSLSVAYQLRARLTGRGPVFSVGAYDSEGEVVRLLKTLRVDTRMPENPDEFEEASVTFLDAANGAVAEFEQSLFVKGTNPSPAAQAAPPAAAANEPMDLQAALAAKDEDAVLAAARGKFRLKSDQLIDIYNLAKELRSNRLMNLVKGLKAESAQVDRLVGQLLEDHDCAPLKDPGLAAEDADPRELAMGIKVELEHTPDRQAAETIALGHLAEDPQYYSKGHARGMFPELGDQPGRQIS